MKEEEKTSHSHWSVTYVEPNDVNLLAVRNSDGTNELIERAPKLEDYCIMLAIEVELYPRRVDIKLDEDNKKLTLVYNFENNSLLKYGHRAVFFKGGFRGNYLSSDYADISSEEIRSYYSCEMLGIKSVNVEYENFAIPQITIVFTDVRGMSMFQPSEIALDKELTKGGFKEIESENLSSAFFRAFFMIPSPKFTIYIKGQYGEPVAYQMACVDFRSTFDAEHGNFDTTVKFVGYTFSFLTEVSLNALISAPYSDYVGAKYWKENVNSGRFSLPANNSSNETKAMPTLCELICNLSSVIAESTLDLANSNVMTDFEDHSKEIEELKAILELQKNWYNTIFNKLSQRYCDLLKTASNDYYDFGVFYVTEYLDYGEYNFSIACKNILSDPNVSNAQAALKAKIDSFNNASYGYTLTAPSDDFSEFTSQKFIKKIVYNGTYQYELDSNSIFKEPEIQQYPVQDSDEFVLTRQEVLDKAYGDSNMKIRAKYCLNAIKVDLGSREIVARINSLSIQHTEQELNEERERIAKLQRTLIRKRLAWYPSIENFTKIMMAHMETLMYMMFNVVNSTSGRTSTDLGVSVGIDGTKYTCSDVTASDSGVIPPFPRVVTTKTENSVAGDKVTTTEDVWIGKLGAKKRFVEVEMVHGLLNGALKVMNKIKASEELNDELYRQIGNQEPSRPTCVVPFPITSFDYFLKENPYSSTNNVISGFAEFASKVALRMYDILNVNYYTIDSEFNNDDKKFTDDDNVKLLGTVEADNFYALNKILNRDLIQAITSETLDVQTIIDIIEGKDNVSEYKENGSWPWASLCEGGLFKDDAFYPHIETDDGNLYPLQGFNFNLIAESLSKYQQQILNLGDYKNVVTPLLPAKSDAMISYAINDTSTVFNNTAFIDVDAGRINHYIVDGLNKNNEAYNELGTKVFMKISSNGAFGSEDNQSNPQGLGTRFRKIFKYTGLCSFCKVHGERASGEFDLPRVRSLRVMNYTNTNLYDPNSLGDIENMPYSHEMEDFENYFFEEKTSNFITSLFLAEVPGCELNPWIGKLYYTDEKSLFSCPAFYTITSWPLFEKKYVQTAWFVLSLQGIDYTEVYNYIHKRTHSYLPNFVVLQIGAIFAALYSINGEFTNSPNMDKLEKKVPLPYDLYSDAGTKFIKYICKFSKSAKLNYIRRFKLWADSNHEQIMKLFPRRWEYDPNGRQLSNREQWIEKCGMHGHAFTQEHSGPPGGWSSPLDPRTRRPQNNASTGPYDKEDTIQWLEDGWFNVPERDVYRAIFVDETGRTSCHSIKTVSKIRILLNEKSEVVRYLSNELLRVVCITKGHIIDEVTDYDSTRRRNSYGLDKAKAKIYLEAFLKELAKNLENMPDSDELSALLQIAASPEQVTEDMKISLYLYLKQLYDKWVPGTTMIDWDYKKCFDENNDKGHRFYFIDSFYNKVGNKIMMNVERIVDKLKKSMLNPDWNAMLLPFISDLYSDHGCMLKTLQNFIDITDRDAMDNMFKPISYLDMKVPNKNPDFVVIFSHKPSENLDMQNGLYENDGFMLNDETQSPLSIVSRQPTPEHGGKSFYQLPAFGVVYGGQYQSYFKKIDINMDNPIATEQSICAKFRIADMYNSDGGKKYMTVGQDLYNVYANRSYMCKITMMGCAWVQPLMYFVLLNIPLFKGSYIITKVSHKMIPGDMETEIQGCRMSRISTKIVDDVLTDANGNVTNNYIQEYKYLKADVTNDCPYQIFPLHEYNGSVDVSADEKEKAAMMMHYLINNTISETSKFTVITAAASVGCMWGECRLDHTAINPNDRSTRDNTSFISGGLCHWRGGNLIALEDFDISQYGRNVISANTSMTSSQRTLVQRVLNDTCVDYGHGNKPQAMIDAMVAKWRSVLSDSGHTIEKQLEFYVRTFDESRINETRAWGMPPYFKDYSVNPPNVGYTIRKYNADCGNSDSGVDTGVDKWLDKYGIGVGQVAQRKEHAHTFLNYYRTQYHPRATPTTQSTPATTEEEFCVLFAKAVKKTFEKCTPNVDLQFEVKDSNANNKILVFKAGNNKNYKVFDIMLNGDPKSANNYVNYVNTLAWVYDSDAAANDAVEIRAVVNETVTARKVIVIEKSNLSLATEVIQRFNTNFFKSIFKRYGGNPKPSNPGIPGNELVLMIDTTTQEYTDVMKEGLKGMGIQSCNEILNGLPGYNISVSPDELFCNSNNGTASFDKNRARVLFEGASDELMTAILNRNFNGVTEPGTIYTDEHNYVRGKPTQELANFFTSIKVKVHTKPDHSQEEEKTLYCHKRLAKNFENALAELYNLPEFFIINGGASIGILSHRKVMVQGRSRTSASIHAFGGAIDLNGSINGFHDGIHNGYNDTVQYRSNDHPVVQIMARHGFRWGGNFSSEDFMHFTWTGG